jgi:hypothetical protein
MSNVCELGVEHLAYAQYKTMLERPAEGKHSSSMRAFVNYGRKEFSGI